MSYIDHCPEANPPPAIQGMGLLREHLYTHSGKLVPFPRRYCDSWRTDRTSGAHEPSRNRDNKLHQSFSASDTQVRHIANLHYQHENQRFASSMHFVGQGAVPTKPQRPFWKWHWIRRARSGQWTGVAVGSTTHLEILPPSWARLCVFCSTAWYAKRVGDPWEPVSPPAPIDMHR